MQDETREIPLAEIVEPWMVLRVVNTATVEYAEMRDSIADKGFWNSVCVRPAPRQPGKYEIIDGLYRYTAACELKLPAMPCIVKHHVSDEDVLAAQIQANAVRPETTPTEYARQMKKIMAARPEMTQTDLSLLLHKNPEWIGQQLELLNLCPKAQKALDRGEIPISSAYMLAKISRVKQLEFLDMAKVAPVKEFTPVIVSFLKKLKERVRQGKLDELYREFEPVPYLRSLTEILEEHRNRSTGGLILAKRNCTSPLETWYLALEWAAHLDPESIEEQRQKVALRLKTHVLERKEDDRLPTETRTKTMNEN